MDILWKTLCAASAAWLLTTGSLLATTDGLKSEMKMEKSLNLTHEWDKVFPKSDKVDHKKVTFHNRYGITLAADMYTPRGTEGGINGSGIDRHTAPATDTDDTDALRVNILLHGEEVYRCAEIFGVDVRRSDIAGCTAALAGVGRVEGNRQEAKLCHFLRIQTGGLLLHRAKRAADGDGGQFAFRVLRHVHVGRQRDAVSVVEGRLAVLNLVAFGEYLVPFLRQFQLLHA